MNIIVARGKNGEIGANNELLWKLPTDMKFFKAITERKVVVMGLNTWKSIGERPLPNRKNIVITSRYAYGINVIYEGNPKGRNGTVSFMPLEKFKRKLLESTDTENLFIIGGKMLYEEFANEVKNMYITDIDKTFEIADTVVNLDTSGMHKHKLYSGIENELYFEINKWERE